MATGGNSSNTDMVPEINKLPLENHIPVGQNLEQLRNEPQGNEALILEMRNLIQRLKLSMRTMPYVINVSTLVGIFVRTNYACLGIDLRFENRSTTIDLIYLPMIGIDIVVCMDWRSVNNTTLNCARKIISLPVYTTPTMKPSQSRLLSIMQEEKCIQYGCQAYVVFFFIHAAYNGGIERIGVVNEFLKVFLEEVSRLPPEREVKFSIDLVPGTEPISKALYRLSPSKLAKLKK
ncbi:uncharacterized protein LOC129286467 [Prosopis cineraria]|uniref:uncharacterized protein LOC129286467 n=1 Tax=Prosopis cineraria TaxID=364024 RepID=UPI00240FA01B|nr:uncharacterized protein LOC129286467 [Prosopis cineraria]